MASSSNKSTENLENKLESFIENMRQINIMVADVQPQAQPVFYQKIQKIAIDLQDINRLKDQVLDVQIPLEVFDYVDQGRNPQLYTKDCLTKAVKKNEEVKRKVESYKKLKANLLVELNGAFPKEVETYRAIRSVKTKTEKEDEEEDETEEEEEGYQLF